VEKIGPALVELDALTTRARTEGSYFSETAAMSALKQCARTYQDLQLGLPVSLNISLSYSSQSSVGLEEVASVRNLLVKYALPRVLGLDARRAAKDGETVNSYLVRMAEEAREARDWPLLGRVLEVSQSLNVAVLGNGNDVGAIRHLLGGTNQERASQFSGAVASYLSALKSGSPIVPAEWIGERLAAIQKSNPKAYEDGVQLQNSAIEPRSLPASVRGGRDPFTSDANVLRVPPASTKALTPSAKKNAEPEKVGDPKPSAPSEPAKPDEKTGPK
jgi:hypothetical protein